MSSSTTTTVVLITGANSGIGLSLAKLYSKRPNHIVVGTTRDLANGKELLEAGCKVVQLDVSSDESCTQLPKRLSEKGISKVDLLINNAGILYKHGLETPSNIVSESLEQFNTNTLGPLRVTLAVLPLLRNAVAEKNGTGYVKIAHISSVMGSVALVNETFRGDYGYRASKAALNMISATLARDLAKENIVSLAVHPGYVSTRMVGEKGHIIPETSATGVANVVDKAGPADAFKLLNQDGTTLPW